MMFQKSDNNAGKIPVMIRRGGANPLGSVCHDLLAHFLLLWSRLACHLLSARYIVS